MAIPPKDAVIPDDAPNSPIIDEHARFILKYDEDKEEYDFVMSEFLRLNAVYWGLTALEIMNRREEVDAKREEVLDYLRSCYHPNVGGYAPTPRHDPSLLCTLSAVQIACTLDARETHLDADAISKYIQSLQSKEDGSFAGDKWGEVDTRFSFAAVAALSLLGRVRDVDLKKATEFVLACRNFDGGFGSKPGSESHSGQIYCCLGFLSIVGRLDEVESDRLGWWLAERQLAGSGGLNGRPEKLPDVCYGWWVLSSLSILGRLDWIDRNKMRAFIVASQDGETGGISDRPGDLPDPFHTLFGVGGLALLGLEADGELAEVNPVYCMPQRVLDKLGIDRPQMLKLGT